MCMQIVLGVHLVTNGGTGTSSPFILEFKMPLCFTAVFPCVCKALLKLTSKSGSEFCDNHPNEVVDLGLVVMSKVAVFKDPPAVIELVLSRATNSTCTVIHRSLWYSAGGFHRKL